MSDKEELVKRNPSNCRVCEFREYQDGKQFCVFWCLGLTEVRWCNK